MRAGARPGMPLMEMFWGDRMGSVVDPCGHAWQRPGGRRGASASIRAAPPRANRPGTPRILLDSESVGRRFR